MTPASSSDQHSAPPPHSDNGRAETYWNLRFKDPELERQYIAQIIRTEGAMSRWFCTIAFFFASLLSIIELYTQPLHIAAIAISIRIPAFFVCWAVWMTIFYQRKFTPLLHILVMFCILAGVLILSTSQWIYGSYGIVRPYQALLLIVMIAPMLGCMPWRIGAWVGLLSGIMVGVPEWVFLQHNPGVRNLHVAYIALGLLSGLFSGYVRERHSRQHFLLNDSFLKKSRVDPLTGLPNRRHLDTDLPRLIRQAAREQMPIAVAMLDVDHFKAYNDHYGHTSGDTVLQQVAHIISRQATHRPDFVARYGGEEFVAIWYNPKSDPHSLAEGLRTAITAAGLPHGMSQLGYISISVGIVHHVPLTNVDAGEILRQADQALYRAKENGRNCVQVQQIRHTATGDAPPTQTSNWLLAMQQEQAETPEDLAASATPTDRRRWLNLRGLIELKQLRGMTIIAFSITVLQILIACYSMPTTEIGLLVYVLAAMVAPQTIIGYYMSHWSWAARNARFLIWPFFIPTGLYICYALRDSLIINQIALPYEVLLIIVYQAYTIGTQTARISALCGWAVTLPYLWLLTEQHRFELLYQAIAPFLAVNIVGLVISRAQDRQSLDSFLKHEKLESLAAQDSLTGLANRHGLTNYIHNLLPLLAAKEYPLTVAMVDVDHFKAYNDQYGHAAGDTILKAVARVLAASGQRPYDLAVRYGGEEFLLIWYQAGERSTIDLGSRVRTAVQALGLPHADSQHGHITVSVGITTGPLRAEDGMAGLKRLIRQADQALYQSKQNGRNRVTLYSSAPFPTQTVQTPIQPPQQLR